MVICLERGADLHMAQLMSLPLTISCFSKIQIGFTFLVPAHPGSPGERAVKWVCVCVCITCRLTFKNGDQLRDPMLGNLVWATSTCFSMTVELFREGAGDDASSEQVGDGLAEADD